MESFPPGGDALAWNPDGSLKDASEMEWVHSPTQAEPSLSQIPPDIPNSPTLCVASMHPVWHANCEKYNEAIAAEQQPLSPKQCGFRQYIKAIEAYKMPGGDGGTKKGTGQVKNPKKCGTGTMAKKGLETQSLSKAQHRMSVYLHMQLFSGQ